MEGDSEINNKNTNIDVIDQDEFISEAKEFFEVNKKEISKELRTNGKAISIDFKDLSAYSPKLAESLIDKPEETIQLLEITLEELAWTPSDIRVRIINLSSTQHLNIRNLRSKHLGKLISINGMIRRASEIRPLVTNISFECPSCQTIISVLQLEKEEKQPSRCSCGRRGGFKEISKDMIDSQILVIEENLDEIEEAGAQPKRINIFLSEDLTDPKMEKRIIPGSRVQIIGTLKEIRIKTGPSNLNRYDIAIEANNIIPLDEDVSEMEISEEDEEEIKKISLKSDLIEFLSRSIAPSICGYQEVKKALVLQLFGGVNRKRTDGSFCREQIHGLLVGDPGCVDKDTEFFNGTTWKKMGEYKDGDLVMQYNKDGTAELVKPTRYIKRKEDNMILIKSKYGVNQCISKDHRVIYLSKRNNIMECRGNDVLRKHTQNKLGFRGKFITTFIPKINSKINLTDEEIRVMVAVHADGHFPKQSKTNWCRINIKKERKKIRVRKLLRDTNLKFKENKKDTGYSWFYFYPPLKTKKYKDQWSKCSLSQLKIIADECLYWDGNQKNIYCTTIKKDADFIQYAMTVSGKRATIGSQIITRTYKGTIRTHILYTVHTTNRIYPSVRVGSEKSREKIITNYKTKDGYSYCFQVPSGMLVLRRGDRINITGNCAKSVILKYISEISYKGRYVSGKSTTAAGITATAIFDENTKAWCLEAGAIVLANKGSIFIDEFDKMDKNDRSNLHEAMEQGTITISKATIQATLSAKTSVLAAANPKFSRFEENSPIGNQINLPPSLLSRFDFIFIMKDLPEEIRDTEIADKIIGEHSEKEVLDILDIKLFKKYIAYAKQFKPDLTKECTNRLKEYYVNLRKRSKRIEGKKIIPLGARQFEGLIRLSEASAKLRLQKTVTKENADEAISVMETYLRQVGYDEEHDTFDIDKISGNSASQRSKIDLILSTIKELKNQWGKSVEIEVLRSKIGDKINENEFDEIVEKLIRMGELFRPTRGIIQLI